MGLSMALRLSDVGFEVLGWNRTRERGRPLEEAGGRLADSPSEVLSSCEVTLVSLSDEEAVREVLLRSGALRRAGGRVVADTTTVTPSFSEEAEREASGVGASYLDAPVLGSVRQAREGTLSIMVGGREEALERARPVLESLGRVFHVGPPGWGSRAKVLINSMLISVVHVAAEGLALAEAMGLDPDLVREIASEHVIGAVIGRYWPRMLSPGEARFSASLAAKDLLCALRTARRFGVPLPCCSAALQGFLAAVRDGLGEEDYTSVFRALRRGGPS